MELAFQLWPTSPAPVAPETKGRKAKRITFLHGMGGTGALWRPIAASLESHYSLLALDQRGHGGSRPAQPATYTPLDFGRDVIETLGIQNFHPTWLIGHSMGVRSACAAAHMKPEWIQGLILVDLGFYGPAGGGLGEELAYFLRILPEGFPSREEAKRFMTEHCPDPAMGQYLMAVSVRDAGGSIRFAFDHSALIQTVEASKNNSIREWIRELGERGMPILALRGAESGVWSHNEFEEEKQRFADLPSIVFREIEGAGHGLPFEQRARFVEAVEGFISTD